MAVDATAAIEARDLSKSFPTSGGTPVRAVDGVDLRIEPGEIVALLGPNGAGKTTLVDMLLGLTEPTGGRAVVYGSRPRAAVRGGRVSAVLQSGGLLRDLSVAETVQVIAAMFETHADVDEVLARAGLSGVARRKVSKCSGGEQQRLRFALALLPEPDLLILDEPTAGMDVTARREFWEAMRHEAAGGRTVLFATHYLAEADQFASRIVMMNAGRVIADGTTEEIRRLAAHRTVTARVPEPERVAVALRLSPAVVEAARHGERLRVRALDSDTVARLLLTEHDASDLLIADADLEEAFVALTETRDEVPA